MSKHTANTALSALVLALAVFVVAFALMLFVGEFGIIASFFLAFLVALLAGFVLFIGFGAPGAASPPMQKAAASPTAATGASAGAAEADADRAAEEAEAERKRAAEQAAAEAERKRAAEAAAAAERKRAEEDAERQRAADAAAAAAAPVAAAAAPAGEDYDGDGVVEGTGEGTRPAGLDSPRDGKADDLKQIKGIGAKLEKLCNSLGFWHFDQIAGWSADEIAWVDANLQGFKGRVTRDDWVGQARILAGGGATEFSKRVEDGDVY